MESSDKSFYGQIGGQAVIDRLVDEFYSVMRTDPAASECLLTHRGRDLDVAAEKLKAFLSGWLGGPPLYLEKHGHPRLRMRHFSFPIGDTEARQWLYCMHVALRRSTIIPETQEHLMGAFKGVTGLIKNRG